MPISIYRVPVKAREKKEIAWLCDNVWELPVQLKALERWVLKNRGKLPKGSYVADLGFSSRPGAAGGGGAVGKKMMMALLACRIELHLSEYPPFVDAKK